MERSKYLGSALKEASTTKAKHKPELEFVARNKVVRRTRNEAVSKSMSINKVAFKLERDDPFDASVSAES